MVTKFVNSGAASLPEAWVEQPDGSFALKVAATSVDGSGNAQSGLPAGRAAAAASVPVAPDTVALAGINQTYTRAAAVGTAGNAVLVTGVTTAGTVTLTLASGSVTLNVPLGSSIWPFGATAAALGTAVGGTFLSLFFV